jgi:glycosyltransferase involved in cell wall biosynthesis
LRVGLFYDMDACLHPTGVTRHALAQLERLAARPEVELSVVSGRISQPDGLAYWDGLGPVRRKEMPVRSRDALRYWRYAPWPPVEWWTGPVDWVYSPAELGVAAREAKLAVTSHDVLQDLRFGGERRMKLAGDVFRRADLILSVSKFNTEQLLDAFPDLWDRVAQVPNAAEDLFFEAPEPWERARVREGLDLPAGIPYLLSVASFQGRKNLRRLVTAAAQVPEVVAGDVALVLIGAGSEETTQPIREAIAALGPRAIARMPGYRQGNELRAVYAEATALVFPSLCESFGIPAVEAMAQGTPVALADTTALPEVGGEAGWYFNPEDEAAIAAAIRDLLGNPGERARRAALGKTRADQFRWPVANDRLVDALRTRT